MFTVSFSKQNFVLFMLSDLSGLFFTVSGFYVLFIPPGTLLLKDNLSSHNRADSSLNYSRVTTWSQVSLDCWAKDFPTKSHHFSVVTSSLKNPTNPVLKAIQQVWLSQLWFLPLSLLIPTCLHVVCVFFAWLGNRDESAIIHALTVCAYMMMYTESTIKDKYLVSPWIGNQKKAYCVSRGPGFPKKRFSERHLCLVFDYRGMKWFSPTPAYFTFPMEVHHPQISYLCVSSFSISLTCRSLSWLWSS